MTRLLAVLVGVLLLPTGIYAQKKELDVRNINTDKYPSINGKLWVRNPDGLNTGSIRFFENDQPINVTFNSLEKNDTLASNKSILFLVLNSTNKTELFWYRDVIKKSLASGAVRKGDKVSVATFSCKDGSQFVNPSDFTFSDDITRISQKVDSIVYIPRSPAYKGRSQVYLAINEALELYQKHNIELPSGIIVLSDDRNMAPVDFQGENPVERSRRLNIPVYAIIYSSPNSSYEIQDLCKQTYGLYYSSKSNDIKTASSQLNAYLNGFNIRYAGVLYPFSYETSFEKDGKPHTVKIDSPQDQSAFVLTTPAKSVFEILKENILISSLVLVIFLGLIVFAILRVRKNRIKTRDLELKKQQQMAEMEMHQRESELKISSQDAELRHIREKEMREKEELIRTHRAEAQAKEDEIQFIKMLERGNLPWFEYKIGDDLGSYQIASPRLSVGRDNSSDWVIPHPTVSRRHFELAFKDYVYTIRDLGSSNGLFVNGSRVKEAVLNHGDLIQAGELSLTFHI